MNKESRLLPILYLKGISVILKYDLDYRVLGVDLLLILAPLMVLMYLLMILKLLSART